MNISNYSWICRKLQHSLKLSIVLCYTFFYVSRFLSLLKGRDNNLKKNSNCMLKIVHSLHKKWNFPLRCFSVNVTKSAVSSRFDTFTELILNEKLHLLCSECFLCRWAIVSTTYKKFLNTHTMKASPTAMNIPINLKLWVKLCQTFNASLKCLKVH